VLLGDALPSRGGHPPRATSPFSITPPSPAVSVASLLDRHGEAFAIDFSLRRAGACAGLRAGGCRRSPPSQHVAGRGREPPGARRSPRRLARARRRPADRGRDQTRPTSTPSSSASPVGATTRTTSRREASPAPWSWPATRPVTSGGFVVPPLLYLALPLVLMAFLRNSARVFFQTFGYASRQRRRVRRPRPRRSSSATCSPSTAGSSCSASTSGGPGTGCAPARQPPPTCWPGS